MPSLNKRGQLPHYRALLEKIISMNSHIYRDAQVGSRAKVIRRRNPFQSLPPAYHMTKRLIVSLDLHDDPPPGTRRYWTTAHPLCIRVSLRDPQAPLGCAAGKLLHFVMLMPTKNGGDVVIYDTRLSRVMPKFATSRLPSTHGDIGYMCVFRDPSGDERVLPYDIAWGHAFNSAPRLQDTWRLAHTCDTNFETYDTANSAATRAQSMCRGLNASLSRYGPGMFTLPLVSKGWSYLHTTGRQVLESGISLWNGNEYIDTFRFMDVRGASQAREKCKAAALNAIHVRFPSI